MKQGFQYGLYCLYFFTALVGFLTIFQLVTIASSSPVIMVVTGDSMYPALKSYDVIIIEPIKKVQINDIVIIDYRDRNSLFSNYDFLVHRVTKIWEKDGVKFIQTKGDNVGNPEYATTTDKLLGKVSWSFPAIGLVIWPPVNFVIIGGALLVFVYSKREKV